MGRPPVDFKTRFWKKVKKTRKCWNWTGNTVKGYGRLSRPEGEECLAHRISWLLHFGNIPKGLKVLHKCDNPICVNPLHLFLGTLQDNSNDMVVKGRSLKGESHPRRKLNTNDVLAIRQMYKTGKYSQQKLATMFNVNQTNIGFIVRRKYWKHI